jgi:ferredoxin-fold anticodon binding domain-containing protein
MVFFLRCIAFISLWFLLLLIPHYLQAAKLQKVSGEGCFVYGDEDTPASAKKKAMQLARRNAIENYQVFVRSSTSVKDFKLDEDQVTTLSAGKLHKIKILTIGEEGRKICVLLEAYVDPDEMKDAIKKEKPIVVPIDGMLLSGEWYPFDQRPSMSSISFRGKDVVWTYDVPEPNADENYAGLNVYISPVSVKTRKVDVRLNSEKGISIFVRFYSFRPGFSKEDADDTYVPAETMVSLKKGEQVITLLPESLHVPRWWRQEKAAMKVKFNPADVRVVQFEAVTDEDVGPVSDTVTIKAIYLR